MSWIRLNYPLPLWLPRIIAFDFSRITSEFSVCVETLLEFMAVVVSSFALINIHTFAIIASKSSFTNWLALANHRWLSRWFRWWLSRWLRWWLRWWLSWWLRWRLRWRLRWWLRWRLRWWLSKVTFKLFKLVVEEQLSLSPNQMFYSLGRSDIIIARICLVEALDRRDETIERLADVIAVEKRRKEVIWVAGASEIGA